MSGIPSEVVVIQSGVVAEVGIVARIIRLFRESWRVLIDQSWAIVLDAAYDLHSIKIVGKNDECNDDCDQSSSSFG